MNDHELLELAAKAAGYEKDWHWNHHFIMSAGGSVKEGNSWVTWNPLTDDGDALRLAVKLELNLWIGAGGTDAEHDDYPLKTVTQICDHLTGDPYAATRRAIVRAAAEIGKGMKCKS